MSDQPTPAESERASELRNASDQLMEFGSPSGVRTNFRKSELDAQQAAALPGLRLAK